MIKKLFIISLLWAVLILVLSSIPGNSFPKITAIPHLDKLVHGALFFIFSLFIIAPLDFHHNKSISKAAPFIVLIIVGLYGGIIEIAQENWFINRSGDPIDLYSDLAGGIIAVLLYYFLAKRLIIWWIERKKL
jgi:VanZ family protein